MENEVLVLVLFNYRGGKQDSSDTYFKQRAWTLGCPNWFIVRY
jgi:hypothetical protein